MTIEATEGPSIRSGQNPPVARGAAAPDYNPDRAPSLYDMGVGLLDPRFGYKNGGGAGSALAYGFAPGAGGYTLIDQVPSAAATANLAALAHVVNGTAMVLHAGTGLTLTTSAYIDGPTGRVVPAGVYVIDGLPGYVAFGQSKAVRVLDPTKAIARAVQISGVLGGAGGDFLVSGYDIYGAPQTELITVAADANTAAGKKAFKFIKSVTPQFTDAENYSAGVADIYGLPLRADKLGYIRVLFDDVDEIAQATVTFVPADTNTATDTTGDVRGTIEAVADNAATLQIFAAPSVANLASLAPGNVTGLFGVTPA